MGAIQPNENSYLDFLSFDDSYLNADGRASPSSVFTGEIPNNTDLNEPYVPLQATYTGLNGPLQSALPEPPPTDAYRSASQQGRMNMLNNYIEQPLGEGNFIEKLLSAGNDELFPLQQMIPTQGPCPSMPPKRITTPPSRGASKTRARAHEGRTTGDLAPWTQNAAHTVNRSKGRPRQPPIVLYDMPSANACHPSFTYSDVVSGAHNRPVSMAPRPLESAVTDSVTTRSEIYRTTQSSRSRQTHLSTENTSAPSVSGNATGLARTTISSDLRGTRLRAAESNPDATAKPRYACPFYRRDPTRHLHTGQKCRGDNESGFGDVGRVRDHISRAHVKVLKRCDKPGCGIDFYRSKQKGKNKSDKARLANECPHDLFDDADYVTEEELRFITAQAAERKLENVQRWDFIYRSLFGLPEDEDVPDAIHYTESIASEVQHREGGGLDAISRVALETHDESVREQFKLNLASITNDKNTQEKILRLLTDSQKAVGRARE